MLARAIPRFASIALVAAAFPTLAADILLTPPAGGAVTVTNAAGNTTRFRVADDGSVTIPGVTAVPVPATGLCVEIATGKVGTCSIGTLTSVVSGTGLTGGPITTTGTLSIAASYQLPQSCLIGQVATSNGAGVWSCTTPAASSGGTVTSIATGTGLTGGPITGSGTISADTSVLQARVSGTCPPGSSIQAIAANGSVTCQADGPANAYVQGGNAFGATATLGTTDNQPVNVLANNVAALRITPNATSPNLLAGHGANSITAGAAGAVVAGGGAGGTFDPYTSSACGTSCANRVTDSGGSIGGGAANQAGDAAGALNDRAYATVSGGFRNTASGLLSTVGGGRGNIASVMGSAVGGGEINTASGNDGTVGGGQGNLASGNFSAVGGGQFNTGSASFSTVGGGAGNAATFEGSTVSGGAGNVATSMGSTVGGGSNNAANGAYSTVPGGYFNNAIGEFSFAAGRRARPEHDGAFVWADSNDFDFPSTGPNEFSARATGGVRFVTSINLSGDPAAGVQLAPGGSSWLTLSDVNSKTEFAALDKRVVLEKVAALPISSWRYKTQDASIRHIGPTAQDFRAAFAVGESERMIATVDADGVALAAIQGMYQVVQAQATRIAELEQRTALLVKALEKLIKVD